MSWTNCRTNQASPNAVHIHYALFEKSIHSPFPIAQFQHKKLLANCFFQKDQSLPVNFSGRRLTLKDAICRKQTHCKAIQQFIRTAKKSQKCSTVSKTVARVRLIWDQNFCQHSLLMTDATILPHTCTILYIYSSINTLATSPAHVHTPATFGHTVLGL